ncbi:glycosyltransferase [Modicisalibacter zincidurans]|uniref:glycosyltransferase n=1 Tax=Modicisalibacter zincidurans TaxID=1178777 RepID=UPI000A016ECF|nr:glycosyltransferase [Halomonas zincidurans]
MNILHVIAAPAAGGAEIYIRDLCVHANANGHEFSIAFIANAKEIGRSAEFEANFLESLENSRVRFFFLPAGTKRNPIRGMLSSVNAIRMRRPDVIHVHLLTGLLVFSLCSAFLPIVYTHHNIKIYHRSWLFKAFMKLSRGYVGISDKCTEVLAKMVPHGRDVRTIHNGILTQRVMSLRDATATPTVDTTCVSLIAVGALSEQKNYPLLLRALALVKTRTELAFHLSIVGEGREGTTQAIQQQIAEQNLANVVTLLGNRSDVPQLLCHSDIFVLSSSWEGLPISLLEAQAAGLPSVVTDVGGCGEVIERTQGGIVVAPEDAETLAVALQQLIEMPEYREKLRACALQNIHHFDISSSFKKHIAYYSELL